MNKRFYFKQFNLALVKKIKWPQILLCIINNSVKRQSLIRTELNEPTALFLTIQFSIMQNSSIWPIDMTSSGATIPGQGGSGSDSNERYSAFPKALA